MQTDINIKTNLTANNTNNFALRLLKDNQTLRRTSLTTLQINLGKMCDLACHHCHVEAGPNRTEIMTRQTIDKILNWLDTQGIQAGIHTIDLTGGAPELNPNFIYLIKQLASKKLKIINRCNLTILDRPGFQELPKLLAKLKIQIVASLPCYLEQNVDAQRGKGTFDTSIKILQHLNTLGYGDPAKNLKLNLVFNPTGYSFPPAQASLEQDYKDHLKKHFDINFNQLFTITNMPIKRFKHALLKDNQLDAYHQKLTAAHNKENIQNLMCTNLISIGWQGAVYDCDFNQMLQLPLQGPLNKTESETEQKSTKLWNLTPAQILKNKIKTNNHCFGCTAGHGSSCSGALD